MLDRPLLGQKTWDALDSCMKLAVTEYYQAPLASILPNVLAHFDLPDCYRVLASKKLARINHCLNVVVVSPHTGV